MPRAQVPDLVGDVDAIMQLFRIWRSTVSRLQWGMAFYALACVAGWGCLYRIMEAVGLVLAAWGLNEMAKLLRQGDLTGPAKSI